MGGRAQHARVALVEGARQGRLNRDRAPGLAVDEHRHVELRAHVPRVRRGACSRARASRRERSTTRRSRRQRPTRPWSAGIVNSASSGPRTRPAPATMLEQPVVAHADQRGRLAAHREVHLVDRRPRPSSARRSPRPAGRRARWRARPGVPSARAASLPCGPSAAGSPRAPAGQPPRAPPRAARCGRPRTAPAARSDRGRRPRRPARSCGPAARAARARRGRRSGRRRRATNAPAPACQQGRGGRVLVHGVDLVVEPEVQALEALVALVGDGRPCGSCRRRPARRRSPRRRC